MNRAMSLLALLLTLLPAAARAQKPSIDGFISIDCGLDTPVYHNTRNGLDYFPDEPYTTTGVNMRVSPETNLSTSNNYYATLRSFPVGDRNCYTLGPVKPGSKYRIKGEFLYGNYDGLRRSPTFDLYLGVNFWVTIETGDFNRAEIITVAYSDSIQVCLVETGKGRPFISTLELRPLYFSMYDRVMDSSTAFRVHTRRNYGGDTQIFYTDDIYDRIWFPNSVGRKINTSQSITPLDGNRYPVPQSVLQTASEAPSLSDTLSISDFGTADQLVYVNMYFAELKQLASNETREFTIFAGSTLFFRSFRPRYLQEDVLYTLAAGIQGGSTYVIQATSNSTLPPIINAIEIFSLLEMPILPTTQRDVKAIRELKNQSRLSRNWEGDPCVPRDFIWKGQACGYDSSNYSTITSLNLSRSDLTGGIPLSIANLTSLTSLDLSSNNLTGEIPEYLGNLASLKFLNLEGNNLGGPVPITLYQRSKSRSIDLRVNNNSVLCSTTDLCTSEPSPKKKSFVIPIAVAVSVIFVIIAAVLVAFCIYKRRQIQQRPSSNQAEVSNSQQSGNNTPPVSSMKRELHSEGNQFSKADIIRITNSLNRPIGKGGFGTVYHGILDDGTEVAVKLLSKLSAHGEKQFRAEADLLTRVHHRYLVSLLGYCRENMALVYEFLPQGSLADHLSGDSANRNILSWSVRLRIALEAAQGLDYLHNWCIPPIIHRDVKPSNFLLTENFEVKIADFGLSRSFGDSGNTFQSTMIAGTPGYLDPEYQQTNRFSESSDVYSFGIVLLQLATGKPAISHNLQMTHITQEVQAKIERGDINNIADPRMQGIFDGNSMWQVIEIGLSCSSFNSSERPTMSEVVSQLKECLATIVNMEVPSSVGLTTVDRYLDNTMSHSRPAAR